MVDTQSEDVKALAQAEHNSDAAAKRSVIRAQDPATGNWVNVAAVDNGGGTFGLSTSVESIGDGTNTANVLKADGTAAGQGSLMTARSHLSVPFTTTIAEAVGTTDAGNYAQVSVHIVTQGGSSTVTFQGSNDNSNWVSVSLLRADNVATVTPAISSTTASLIYSGPLNYRYFRLNVTGIVSGTTAGVIEFFTSTASQLTNLIAIGSVTPGTVAAGLGKAEDGAHASGDTGVFALAVRRDAPGVNTNAVNDYSAIRVDSMEQLAMIPGAAATATLTNVNDTASSTTLLASATTRKGVIIHNDSSSILYIKFGATASTTSYTYKIAADGTWEQPTPIYTGIIDGIWSSDSTGAARITELT